MCDCPNGLGGLRATSLEEAVKALKSVKLADAPGKARHYHNPNFHVAARIVEVVSGEDFGDYLRRHIFEPLGMKSTTSVLMTPGNNTTDIPNLENGGNYLLGKFIERNESYRFLGGSHGIVSTAGDMAIWMKVYSDVLSDKNTSYPISKKSIYATVEPILEGESYGFGWITDPYNTEMRISHSGSTFTYISEATLLPQRGYSIVVLTNSRSFFDISYPLTEGIIALIKGESPDTGKPMPLYGDLILVIFVAVTLFGAIRGLRHARIWAERNRTQRWYVIFIKMIPYLTVLVLAIFFPNIIRLMGRDASWVWVTHLWLIFVAWFAILVGAISAVITARMIALLKLPE